MTSPQWRASGACLFTAFVGLVLFPAGLAVAQSKAKVKQADLTDEPLSEPDVLVDMGPSSPMPARVDKVDAAEKPAKSSNIRTRVKKRKTTKGPAEAVAPVEKRGIQQTAGFFGKSSTGSRKTASPGPQSTSRSAPPAQGQPGQGQSGMSDIERELQELYRKNGRQMPNMNVEEFQVQPDAPPRIPGSRHGPSSTSSSPNRATIRPSKPNFLERVFKLGRGKSKPQEEETQPRSRTPQSGFSPNGMRSPPAEPFRPGEQSYSPSAGQQRTPPPGYTVTPGTPPRSGMPMREPTAVGPIAIPPEPPSPQSAARPVIAPALPPAATSRDSQPFFDESTLQGDSENLDLAEDEPPHREAEKPAKTAETGPRIEPEESAKVPDDSPYSGLRIAPNEIETRITLDAPLTTPETGVNEKANPAAEAAPSKTSRSSDEPASGLPTQERSGSAGPTLKPRSPGVAPPDEDESLELDDEDAKDSNNDEKPKPPRAASTGDEPLSIPNEYQLPKLPESTPKPVENGEEAPEAPIRQPEEPTAASKEAAKPTKEIGKGFKGFCPVVLKDERRLVEARPDFKSEFRGRTYTFSSLAARQAFEESPQKYVPAGGGQDVVRLAGGDAGVEGSLEHAAWYRGRLYLFSSAETRREFVESPAKFHKND
jgi:YHS domain-containing protein